MVSKNNKTTRKKKSKRTKQKKDKLKLLTKTCKNFGKPIYLMRHLNTDANIIADSFIGKTYNKIKGTKGGSLKHYLPYLPGIREPNITGWGRNDVKSLPKRYGITKTDNDQYTVIVSPLMRTWVSALLFIRALMKDKPFSLTLLISPMVEKSGFGGNTPLHSSYKRFFKEEVKETEHVTIKCCSNINRKKKVCDVIEIKDSKKLYNIINTKNYKPFNEGGMLMDETLYMISKSCKTEFNNMKQILIYSHSGSIRNLLTDVDYPKEKVSTLKSVNGYAVIFTLRNNKVKITIKFPKK